MSSRQRDTENPYLAPEAVYEPALDTGREKSEFRLLRILLGLQLATLAVGLCVAAVHIESIVATGPLISVFGFLLAGVSLQKGVGLGVFAGASAPAFSLAIFLTINLLGWSPSDARLPVPILGLFYAAVLVAMAVALRIQLKARDAGHAAVKSRETADSESSWSFEGSSGSSQ